VLHDTSHRSITCSKSSRGETPGNAIRSSAVSTDPEEALTRVGDVRRRLPCARAPRDRATAHAPLSGQHTEALTELHADPDVARYIGGAPRSTRGHGSPGAPLRAVWREYGFGQSALSTGEGRSPPRPRRAAPLAAVGRGRARATSSPGTRRAVASPARPPGHGSTSPPPSWVSTASPPSSTPTTHRAGRWPPGSASASTART
jgi:hypothetical protein